MLDIALLLAVATATIDALNVTVPSTVAAGAETEITVGFDFWKQPFVCE